MDGFDTSLSPLSFRRMLLTATIWPLITRQDQRPMAAPAGIRNQSSETAVTEVSARSDALLVDKERENNGPNNQPGFREDPFAGGVEGGIEYKTMTWWHAGMVMVAETISLGILSLPMALATLGIIPGLILLLSLGAMASYSGYVIGQFKIAYPHVHSWADAGEVLCGKIGREILGIGQLLFFVFIMGSHILTFAVMMKTITDHGACAIVFTIVGTVLSFIFTLPRTLKNLSYYSIASFISIIGAVMITMIGVSITKPGQHLNVSTGQWVQEVRLWPRADIQFHSAFLAVTNIVFAYAGHAAFFSFISELKDPKDFPKALAFLQISDISMYIVTAVVVYYYAGNNVTSPALNSSGPLVRKIAYGIAIPTIVIAGVVNGHVAVKYLYVRLLRGNKEDIMHQKSLKAVGLWAAICGVLWIFAWVIAEGVPVFNDLLGITSALFASWLTFGMSSIFWFFLNSKDGQWRSKRILAVVNCINLVIAMVTCAAGIYASSQSIATNSASKKPFRC